MSLCFTKPLVSHIEKASYPCSNESTDETSKKKKKIKIKFYIRWMTFEAATLIQRAPVFLFVCLVDYVFG